MVYQAFIGLDTLLNIIMAWDLAMDVTQRQALENIDYIEVESIILREGIMNEIGLCQQVSRFECEECVIHLLVILIPCFKCLQVFAPASIVLLARTPLSVPTDPFHFAFRKQLTIYFQIKCYLSNRGSFQGSFFFVGSALSQQHSSNFLFGDLRGDKARLPTAASFRAKNHSTYLP